MLRLVPTRKVPITAYVAGSMTVTVSLLLLGT